MSKKIFLFFSCLSFIYHAAHAQKVSAVCKEANDSVKAHFGRGEMGCYINSKSDPNAYLSVRINKSSYSKTAIRNLSKDTSAMSDIKKAFYQKSSAGKSVGKDTSNEFKLCYNKAFQQKLDSAFKCDFFRKSDSIFKAYDNTGRGYRSAEFPGGAGALQKFMDKNVALPKDVKLTDSTNMVRVLYAFYIDEKGVVTEPKLVKSNCKECEEVVLGAIKKLPPFVPATEAGILKKVKYILPYKKTL